MLQKWMNPEDTMLRNQSKKDKCCDLNEVSEVIKFIEEMQIQRNTKYNGGYQGL